MSVHPTELFFVGSYADPEHPGIHAVTMDESGSGLAIVGSFAGISNPSHLAVDPAGEVLFAVSEIGGGGNGAAGAVASYRIDRTHGGVDLELVARQPSGGDHPCHVRMDHRGRWIAVSNYGTGSVAVLPVGNGGDLGPPSSIVRHSGSGPRPDRQAGPHAHASVFTPDNRHLIVADLGIDRLVVYGFDELTGALERHGEVVVRPGAGPRHLAFHPGGAHLFVSNEFDDSVTVYGWDAHLASLTEEDTCPTVPAPTTDANTVADIHVSASGSHVYVSNRGDDSIAVFAFDAISGLERTAVRPSGGAWPRGFGLTPGGRQVVVANRHSDEVVVLPIEAGGADLGDPVARIGVDQPTCIAFA